MGFQIERLAVLSDNYIFLLHDPQSHTAAVVDPAEAKPVLQALERLGARLTAIFNTHHHGDHVGGNSELLRHFPGIPVYGSAQDAGRIPGQTVQLQQGDHVSFAGVEGTVFFVPGHTRGHIAYLFPGHLFCGDTLFAGGCGRLFEGTAAQMVTSLDKLRSLPDPTQVWCAHEYTLGNLRFALTVDGENPALQERLRRTQVLRSQGEATVPSTIGVERETNPFLRVDEPALHQVAGSRDRVEVFAHIRSLKDHF
ncbi:hydroxyacylglutathione hydrolase [Anthocerotibacter panamensis]|uniref:hydroxyacylglutathione hydrolase n=1 Tax=Anthocerotibacter panamensis TaxID=2857077 RepID=UPI001C4042DE|nr:hydroxyacylglutathione hydrolase [Anthocerotibacter panamensis]